MSNIHICLQGKGGVGKSFVSSLLAQYLQEKGTPYQCVDADPINKTLLGFKALPVHHLELLDGDEINPRSFDGLIELIASKNIDTIVDNGASSFVPLSHYLISNHVPAMLHDMGHQLVIHSVIAGGQALLDTLNGLSQLLKQFPESTKFVVWLNPFWGAVSQSGKEFEDMKLYQDNAQRIHSIIRLPELKKETFGYDLGNLLQERMTFTEALNSDKNLMTKQRIKIIRDGIYKQLDIGLCL